MQDLENDMKIINYGLNDKEDDLRNTAVTGLGSAADLGYGAALASSILTLLIGEEHWQIEREQVRKYAEIAAQQVVVDNKALDRDKFYAVFSTFWRAQHSSSNPVLPKAHTPKNVPIPSNLSLECQHRCGTFYTASQHGLGNLSSLATSNHTKTACDEIVSAYRGYVTIPCTGFTYTCPGKEICERSNDHRYKCHGGCGVVFRSEEDARDDHKIWVCSYDQSHKYYYCSSESRAYHTIPDRNTVPTPGCEHRYPPCLADLHTYVTKCPTDTNCIATYWACRGHTTHQYPTGNNQGTNNNVVTPPPTPPPSTPPDNNEDTDDINDPNHPDYVYSWDDPCGHRLTYDTMDDHEWVSCIAYHPTYSAAICEGNSNNYYECQTHVHVWYVWGVCGHKYNPEDATATAHHTMVPGPCSATDENGNQCVYRNLYPCDNHTHDFD